MSKKKNSRERIVAGARELFAEKGYQATSISEIATTAGLSEGAIYRYFNSKEDLLLACVKPALDDSLDLIKQKDLAVSDLRSFTRLLLEKRLALFHKHYLSYKILFTEAYFNKDLFKMMCETVLSDDRLKAGTEMILGFEEIKRLRNYFTIMLSQVFALWSIHHLRNITGELREYLPEGMSRVSDQDLLDDMTDFILYGITENPPAGSEKDENNGGEA